MKRWLRWIGLGVLALATLACLALASIYVASEPQLRRTYEAASRPFSVPTDAASIAEGRRLATIRGCNDGCHGKGVSGGTFWSEPWGGTLVAPELTRIAASHSDAELERVIRQGVRKDGRTTWGMPSSMFYHLSDEDFGLIIAFLRSLPPGDGPDTAVSFSLLGRLEIMAKPEYAYAKEIGDDAPWLTEAELAAEHGAGHYLAITVCSECHGMDLKGDGSGATPDLAIAVGYTKQQFNHLMRTGEPVGGRKLELMAEVAQDRFSHFTDDEVRELYNYLVSRAKGQP